MPLLNDHNTTKSGDPNRGENNSNVLPFFLALKLSEWNTRFESIKGILL